MYDGCPPDPTGRQPEGDLPSGVRVANPHDYADLGMITDPATVTHDTQSQVLVPLPLWVVIEEAQNTPVSSGRACGHDSFGDLPPVAACSKDDDWSAYPPSPALSLVLQMRS